MMASSVRRAPQTVRQSRCGLTPFGAKSADREDPERELRLDEDHQRVAQHAVICHSVGYRIFLHLGHVDVHVCNVHKHCHTGPVLSVDAAPDVVFADGSVAFFALWPVKPWPCVLRFGSGVFGC